MENVMTAKTDSLRNPKKEKIAQSDVIRDADRLPERAASNSRIDPKKGKFADNKVAGRMPERSEAISGDETDGLTPISVAAGSSVTKAKSVYRSVKRAQTMRPSGVRR